MHPSVKDYTHYSHARNKCSRLDYFFISQKNLPRLTKTTVEPMMVSDHNTVTLTLSCGQAPRLQKIWHYNSSVLPDELQTQEFGNIIDEYFILNGDPEVDPMIVWKAHKCVIRGELMAKAARAKRQQLEALT